MIAPVPRQPDAITITLRRLQIDGLPTLDIGLDIKGYSRSFGQKAHARHCDGTQIHEHVFAAAIGRDEAKATPRVEEKHGSNRHCDTQKR